MATYYVYIGREQYRVEGVEAAYAAYERAAAFCELLVNVNADLVDGETGEIIATTFEG